MTEREKQEAWAKHLVAKLNTLTPPNRQRALDQIIGYASCKVAELGGGKHATADRQPTTPSDA